MFNAFQSSRKLVLGLALVMGAVACWTLGLSIYGYYSEAAETIGRTERQAERFAQKLSAQFQRAQSLLDTRLPELSANPTTAPSWLSELHEAILTESGISILSFGVAFEPYAFSRDQRLYAPMFLRQTAITDERVSAEVAEGTHSPGSPNNFPHFEFAQFRLGQFGTVNNPDRGRYDAPAFLNPNRPSSQERATPASERGSPYRLVHLHDVVDYTLAHNPADPDSYDSSWYQLGLSAPADRGQWQQPYYGEILKSMLSEYSRPFYGIHPVSGKRQKLGMVYLDLSLADVRDTVQNLALPPGAYGVLLSDEARVVSHPIRSWLGQPLSETMARRQPKLAKDITAKVARGESFRVTFDDPISGQAFTAVHRSIPDNYWSFGLTLSNSNLYRFAQKQRLLLFAAGFALGVMILSLIVARALKKDDLLVKGWRISYAAVVWALVLSCLALGLFVQTEDNRQFTKLLNPTDLRNIAQTGEQGAPLLSIPTGILIEDIKFSRHDEITLSGLVWQVADRDLKEGLLGVEFSGSQLDKARTEKVFETVRKGNTVHGWRFTTTQRYRSNVGQYPFDQSLIRLELAPLDRHARVRFIPDFNAYDLMVPTVLPGVDAELRLKYWHLRESYFSKREQGELMLGASGHQGVSLSDHAFNNVLLFNISLGRKWLSPIVAYVLPIFIGSIMIFIVLMIPSDRSSGVVFSTLSYGSTIYFVISIFHVGLRNTEGIDGLTYLESYYIIMHAMVMLVSLNGFLLMLNKGPSWIFYRDNAVPRMLYWPFITFSLLLMTVLYFVLPAFM